MTPLCDVLRNYAAQTPARFHMPGHKGGPLPLPELSDAARLDVTEIPGTGNLYLAGEPFDSAQKPWAERFGFDHCQFLTGGSTMGIHTGLSLLCAPGDQILVDRNCHRAVFNAMALLDLEPVYLERPWLEQENLIGPITPEQVEISLRNHPNIKTVCITSPTYAGVLSDIEAISRVVHAHGGRLFVDGAHGAHLPFLGLTPFAGADGVVVSAHKTLPALGQAALLFTNGMDPDRVRRMASVFGTSSPSYPILASMDAARAWLEGDGARAYRQTALRVAQLRSRFPSLTGDLSLDPARLTLNVQDGPSFARSLEEQNIFPEMEDGGHVVFICTPQDLGENFGRLERALEELEGGDMRTVLHFHPALAPVKIGVLPLSKKLADGAQKVYQQLSKKYNCEYDDRGNIGKRYRRQDEIGTPFCITYDFESENDGAVTVRDRDTMEQERVKIEDLKAYFEDKFDF